MQILYWLAAVNLLPVVALVLLVVRPSWSLIPWMGLLTVVIGTFPAFAGTTGLCKGLPSREGRTLALVSGH